MSKKEVNKRALINQVKRECSISTAKVNVEDLSSHFLKHLYRHEKGLGIKEEINQENFDGWVEEKKDLWNKSEDKNHDKIEINGKKFEITDNTGINNIINPHGLFYRMKHSFVGVPAFLLAKINKTEERKGYKVFYLGKEYARDLMTSYYSQCELLDNFIICRLEAEQFVFFELLEKAKDPADENEKILQRVFRKKGVDLDESGGYYEPILNDVIELHISHELGHAIVRDKKIFTNELFSNLINKYNSDIKWFVFALHEALADVVSGGQLDYTVRRRDDFLLGLYVYDLISQYNKHPILDFKLKLLFNNPINLKAILKMGKWGKVDKKRQDIFNHLLRIVKKIDSHEGEEDLKEIINENS